METFRASPPDRKGRKPRVKREYRVCYIGVFGRRGQGRAPSLGEATNFGVRTRTTTKSERRNDKESGRRRTRRRRSRSAAKNESISSSSSSSSSSSASRSPLSLAYVLSREGISSSPDDSATLTCTMQAKRSRAGRRGKCRRPHQS